MVDQELFIDREWLGVADDDSYFWADLLDLRVVNQSGVALGKVDKVLETGANDVLQVSGERQRLIPFVLDTYITTVDLENGSQGTS